MAKLLGYIGIGFGVIFSLGIVAMLVLQPATGPAEGAGGAVAEGAGAEGAGGAVAEGAGGAVAAAPASAGFNADTKRQLEGLGFRVFGDPPQAEDFLLQTLEGGELRLSSFEGKVVLINFWATWCPPCIEEMPSMQRLYDSLPRDTFEILAINMQEDRATVHKFISEHNFEYPILLDLGGVVARRYAVRGLPTSYVIAPDGSMPAALIGFAHWDEPGFVEFFQNLTGAAHASM